MQSPDLFKNYAVLSEVSRRALCHTDWSAVAPGVPADVFMIYPGEDGVDLSVLTVPWKSYRYRHGVMIRRGVAWVADWPASNGGVAILAGVVYIPKSP